MKKTIFFCGVPVTVVLTQVIETAVPNYIREKLEENSSYIQRKRGTGTSWYFCKVVSANCVARYYMGEFPIVDTQ